ncbi:MAG: Gfo/Idh/MocA family oxidoreductase [Nitrososphaerota archaeon]
MVDLIRFGVIGLGDFGERHVQALKSIAGVEVVAVCSRTRSRAEEVARRYGVKKWYTDREKLVRDDEVDAVTIATADDDHVEPTILAAEAGKPALLEKPMATTLEDADKIISAVKKSKIIFMVGHILRFDKRYRTVWKMVREGRLGRIGSMYARRIGRQKAAGIFLNRVSAPVQTGVHDIDIIRWITGREVVQVSGFAARRMNYKYPDIFWTVMRFDDGTLGIVENGFMLSDNYPHFIDSQLEVIAEKGTIHILTPGEYFSIYSTEGVDKPDVTYWPKMNGHAEGALKDELEYFARCVREGRQPEVIPIEDARRALEIAIMAMKSAEQGATLSI